MAEPLRGAAHRFDPARMSGSCSRSWRTTPAPHPGPGTSRPIIRRARTSRSTRTPPTSDPSSSPRRARSCRFPKSAVCTIATCAGQRSSPPPLLAATERAPLVRSACPLTLMQRESGLTVQRRRPENAGPPTRPTMSLRALDLWTDLGCSLASRTRFWRRTGAMRTPGPGSDDGAAGRAAYRP